MRRLTVKVRWGPGAETERQRREPSCSSRGRPSAASQTKALGDSPSAASGSSRRYQIGSAQTIQTPRSPNSSTLTGHALQHLHDRVVVLTPE